MGRKGSDVSRNARSSDSTPWTEWFTSARQASSGRALAWKPANRERVVSAALQAYALLTTSADTGAVRDLTQLKR